MTSIRLTMDDFGALRVLDGALAAARDLTPAMQEIEGELLAISDRAFRSLASPFNGEAWAELHPDTKLERASLGYSNREVLRRTERLRQSVQTESGPNHAAIGASVEYALAHQLGVNKTVSVRQHTRNVTKVWGRQLAAAITQTVPAHTRNMLIPARPYVGASEKDIDVFSEIIADHVRKGTL